MPSTRTLEALHPLPVRLEVAGADDHRCVFLNGYLTARYSCQDKATERIVVTQLAEVLPLRDQDIAAAFGMHPVTLSRFRGQIRSGGVGTVLPRKSGPQGPHKVTAKLLAQCRTLREQGLSYRHIAEQVSRPGRKISYGTVKNLLRAQALPPTPSLPLEAGQEAAPPPEPSQPTAVAESAAENPTAATTLPAEVAPASAPEAIPPASETAPAVSTAWDSTGQSTRYAGAVLLYAALGRLDLWGVFRQLGAAVGSVRDFGWAQIVAAVVFWFALRFHSIEDGKNARRRDLGVVLGTSQAPSLLTLRTKLKALTESVDPAEVSRQLFRRYLALEPVWEGLYYVDGHFCPYYGQHPTPKGWDPKRRLAVKGHTDVYLHDVRGRVLFFLSQPLNDSLARALPRVIEEIRRVHGPGPFTLVFDRGGYSSKGFRFLQAEGIGFITYLRGRSARRRYPAKKFRRGWFSFEGRRHSYRLFEKKTRVRPEGHLRTILFEGDEEQQVPLLTNLAAQAKPAKVVHCLQLRWRQENSFKFLNENYDIDQIIQYGADAETADRLIPNPRYKALKAELRTRTQQIQTLEAQLGWALESNEESQRRTARGVKIAHSRLRREIAHQRQALARLENRLRHTPSKVSAQKVDKTRALLREDRRLVVNALKLAAANAERMLARRFDHYYRCPKDAFSIFRGLLQLPGEVRALGPDRLQVWLQRPDSEKVARALQALLDEVNQEAPRMLGDGPILGFHLAGR